MRAIRWTWRVALLASSLVAGLPACEWLPKRPATPLAKVTPHHDPYSVYDLESEFAVITQLIDQPAGSHYLNHPLWTEIRDPLPHALSTLLAANGLRLGLSTGQPPKELERLGTSESSSIGLTQRSFPRNQPRTISVQVLSDLQNVRLIRALPNEGESAALQSPDCGLVVSVVKSEGERVTVRFQFQIEHGPRQPWLTPTADGTGFARTERRSIINDPAWSWELTLGRRDLLVLGATEDCPGTLGRMMFLTNHEGRRRQRVFLFQVGSTHPDRDATEFAPAQGGNPGGSMAWQAWRGPRRSSTPAINPE
jgi:hypothetical protein